jgi:signal transduction histidine kinase/ActR/RegA family two-component response regulator
MVDTAPVGVFYWDENLRLVDCNAEVLNMFGVSDKSEVLADFFKFSPEYQPDGTRSKDMGETLLRQALENGHCASRWLHITSRGEQIPCEMTLTRAARSGTRMVVVYMRDLREHARMLAEIEKNNTLLHAVNETASILLTADSTSFERSCWQCFEMLGKDIEVNKIRIWQSYTNEIKSYYALKYEWSDTDDFEKSRSVAPEILTSKVFADWKEAFLAGQCINGPSDSFTPAIENFLLERGIVSVLVVPIFLENEFWGFSSFADMGKKRTFTAKEESILKSGTLILASAMTRNNMTQNLIEAREEAIANTRAKSAFLATMSHELRTPLNAIIGFAGIQMQNSLPKETCADFEKIHNSGSVLLGIINDMLDISKIESDSFELIETEYDLASLVNDTVQFNIAGIDSRPIVFELALDSNIPSRLLGDELRVKQILNNILSNAFKYTQRGKVVCSIGFENQERFLLVVSVEDTGMGIKTEDMRKLFSDYSQLDSSAHRKIAGTGLGLSITKKLVDMMDGEISVESEYKKGSVFTVRIPQTIVDGTPIGKQTVDNIQSLKFSEDKKNATKLLVRANLSYARVLVVDDVQTNLDVARGLLLPYGLAVDCVLNAKKAIDLVKNGARYDAIFMDQMMPVMNGAEAVRAIRAIDSDYAKKVPIIALTANAVTGSEEIFLDSGFDAYLSKPIDLMRLDAALNHFVRDKNLENGGGNE